MPVELSVTAICAISAALALIGLGGGFYETAVVDLAWPKRPEIVQPKQGGIDRKRFWIAAHVAFELSLVLALTLAWSITGVRSWLLIALASRVVMRLWSAFDFIPKALAFERAASGEISEERARSWTRRSRLRLPLDLVTCGAMLAALTASARLAH